LSLAFFFNGEIEKMSCKRCDENKKTRMIEKKEKAEKFNQLSVEGHSRNSITVYYGHKETRFNWGTGLTFTEDNALDILKRLDGQARHVQNLMRLVNNSVNQFK